MLNTRYFIMPDSEGKPMVRPNFQALGNAWFVEDIRIVNTAEDEIAQLEYLDPRADAIVNKEFEHLVKGFDPVRNGTITLTEYAPNKLKYTSDAMGDQLAVFSEVWYGPNKGWHAYIDGQPAELLRANYILRALNVPAGKHEIEMVFHPKMYYVLKTVATIVSILIVIGLVFMIYLAMRKNLTAVTFENQTSSASHHTVKKSSKAAEVQKEKK
jgi:hypothetical protein